MKIYIVTKFKTYDSTQEIYRWTDAFRTRGGALRAIRAEIASDIDADMEGSEDNTPEERDEIIKQCTADAFVNGERDGYHTAILFYGDFTAYYAINETDI